ncbi:hypothetical protein TeGR_g12193, partial [Tetraparma gracilis]
GGGDGEGGGWEEFLESKSFDESCSAEPGREGGVDFGCEPGKEYMAVVELLLDAGADVNMVDMTGKTVIMLAAAAGHKGLVSALLETGKVDLQLVDKEGLGAITYAKSDAVRDLLVDYLVKTVGK